MATNDDMSKYDNLKDLAEIAGLSAAGYGALKYSTSRDAKKNAKVEADDILRKSSTRWRVSEENILAARAHVNILETELKNLEDGDGNKSQISKAQKQLDKAITKVSSLKDKYELKKNLASNPDASATDIKDKLDADIKLKADEAAYFKTEQGKRSKKRIDMEAAKAKSTPKALSRRAKFPINQSKALLGSAAVGGLTYLATKYGKDWTQDVADDSRRISEKYKGKVTNRAEKEAQDWEKYSEGMGFLNDYAGYGTAAAGLGLGTKYAGDLINARYNVGRYTPDEMPDGMNNWQSVNQLRKDIGAATTAPFKQIGAKRRRYNPFGDDPRIGSAEAKKRRMDAYDIEREELKEAKRKRFRDPNIDAREKFNRDLKNRNAAKAFAKAEAEKQTKPTESVEKQYIRKNIEAQKNELRTHVNAAESRLKQGGPGRENFSFDADNKIISDAKSKLEIFDRDLADLRNLPDNELRTNANNVHRFKPYMSEGTNRGSLFGKEDKILIEALRVENAAKATADDLKNKADEVVKTGTKKAKTAFQKAKEMPGNMYDNLTGRTAKAGLSQTADVLTTPVDSRSLLRKGATAAVNNPLTRGAAKVMSPGLAWNVADMAGELYASDDKEQYLRDTGKSMWDGLTTEAKDYYTMLSDGDVLEAVGKFTDEVVLQGLEQSGKAMYNVGALGANALIGDDYLPIASMEDRGFTTTIQDSMDQGGYYGDFSNKELVPDEFHASEQAAAPPAAPVSDKPTKSTGVQAPGTEDLANKKKEADAKNLERNKHIAAMQAKYNEYKYAGYNNAQDYADQYDVQALDGSDGRYGNTPVYAGVDEYGNASFSDVPTNVMDPAKYDKVASQAADKAREQFLKFKKGMEQQAKQQARGEAFAGVPDEEFYAMHPADRGKARLEFNRTKLNKATEKDLYDRNKAMSIGLTQNDPGYIEQLTEQVLKGNPTKDEMLKAKYNLNKKRIDDSFKWNPFASTPDPYAVHPREDLSGYLGDSVEQPMEPLAKGYTRLAPYVPK